VIHKRFERDTVMLKFDTRGLTKHHGLEFRFLVFNFYLAIVLHKTPGRCTTNLFSCEDSHQPNHTNDSEHNPPDTALSGFL